MFQLNSRGRQNTETRHIAMQLDPRDIITADVYDNISSDGDEEAQIQRELEEMERRKLDLQERLQRKQAAVKKADPNFQTDGTGVQVPSSPKKASSRGLAELARERDADSYEEDFIANQNSGRNPNELALLQSGGDNGAQEAVNATTSYFMEKFKNSKKVEKIKSDAYESMLSCRVHTFGDENDSTEYKPAVVNEIEEYSHLWISRRYVPKDVLQRTMKDIKVLRLNKLFAKIRPPKFEEPQYSNWAVLGIISAKSDVKFTSSNKPQKFIKFTVTNFVQQIDLFIFGDKGVKRYFNLRTGDIVAILNPEILPWRPSGKYEHIKSFNLRISHNFKCILEIGKSRDLGYCPVINRQTNNRCGTAINLATDKCCEYHREIEMRNSNSKRLDLNGGFALGAPTKVGVQPTLFRKEKDSVPRQGRLGTPRGHVVPRGKANFSVIPNQGIRNLRGADEDSPLGGKRRHFSSSNAAKAFFDDDFQNPDMLANLDSKRRMIQDGRKDSKLDRALGKILKPATEDDELSDKSAKEINKMKQATETVLQTGIIQRIGFDPTHGQVASMYRRQSSMNKSGGASLPSQSERTQQKDVMVDELLHLKKAKVNLRPSKKHLIQRRRHREEVWNENFGEKDKSCSGDVDLDSDSDSDLEIV